VGSWSSHYFSHQADFLFKRIMPGPFHFTAARLKSCPYTTTPYTVGRKYVRTMRVGRDGWFGVRFCPGHGSYASRAVTTRSMTIWMPSVDAAAVATAVARHIYRETWDVFLRDHREWSYTGGEAGPLGGDGGGGHVISA
jgi:hypothetical protein